MDIDGVLADQNPHWADAAQRRGRRWPFRRRHVALCVRRLSDTTVQRAWVLVGARHVGKTVVLWQALDELLDQGVPADRVVYCNLADERWPEVPSPRDVIRSAERRAGSGASLFVLLDEIQQHAKWHAWLKSAVDEDRHRYVVTGSAATALRTGARESGLGRWDEAEIEGLTFAEYRALITGAPDEDRIERELPNAFERYLVASGFPAHALEESADLVRERLREDIAERAILRDLLRLKLDVERAKNLFTYFAQHSGAVFHSANVAAELGIDRKTLARWFVHLQDTRLLLALPSWITTHGRGPGKARTILRYLPRVYVADHGLVTAFAPVPRPLGDPHVRGKSFEALTFRHLREAIRRHPDPRPTLSYCRVRDNEELDFVVHFDGERMGIEVSASAPRPEKLRKVRAAAERSGIGRALLVCDAVAEDTREGVLVVPIESFARDPQRFVVRAS